MQGQFVLEVRFIFLHLALLVIHALQCPNSFIKIEAVICAHIFVFLLLPSVEELKPCMLPFMALFSLCESSLRLFDDP